MNKPQKIVKGACPHDCPDQCAWNVVVENERAIDVHGDPSHPFTQGALCTKLKDFVGRVYSDQRLLYPLRRIGRKGEARFERVTWEEALGDIAAKLRANLAEHGGASILPYSFAGTIGLLQRYAGSRFFRHIGATAVEGDYCGNVAYTGVAQTNGNGLGLMPEDLAHSRFIVLWGTNTVVTNLHLWSTAIRKARAAGAKVCVIDPVKTRTAERADWYLQIQPGTDAALALGVMHILIRDDLIDHDYVAAHTLGFDALSKRVAQYDPARVANITGISEADIALLATELANNRPAAIRLLVGMERRTHGSEAFRAIACIPSLTGAWRQRGGGLANFTADLFRESLNYDALHRSDLTAEPPRSIHIAQLGRALTGDLDPAIRTLFVYNANPAVAAPNQNLVLEGLARDDLFTVVHEQFMTDTARYADYVLPATTQLEHLDLMASWGSPYLTLNQQAIEPVGDAISNTELYRQLASEMGFEEAYLQQSDASIVEQILEFDHPHLEGITTEVLRTNGWARLNLDEDWRPYANGGFATASTKCEFYSANLLAAGIDPLPTYTPLQRPDKHDAHPLNLVAAKTAHHALNTQYINLTRRRRAQAQLEINMVDAASRGISNGDRVCVFNERGQVELNANVSDTTASGVVSIPFNWWPSSMHNGSSANALTADGLTTIDVGSDAFDTFVEVRSTEGQA